MTQPLEVTEDLEGTLRDEVTFWQTFILRYKNKGESAVLSRAVELLNLAEEKLVFYRRIVDEELSRIQKDTQH